MYKHALENHKNESITFDMNITGRFRGALTRQIDEAIRIKDSDPKTLLNSKSEFHGPSVKRKNYA